MARLGIGADEKGLLFAAKLGLRDAGEGTEALGNVFQVSNQMTLGESEADIVELNIPTGVPLLYELDANLKPLRSRYLGDPEAIKAAAEAVRRQTEKKA